MARGASPGGWLPWLGLSLAVFLADQFTNARVVLDVDGPASEYDRQIVVHCRGLHYHADALEEVVGGPAESDVIELID